jgi:hypothetical protein
VLVLGLDVQTIVSDRASVTEALIEHELAHVAHSRANPTVYAAVDRGLRGEASPIFLNLFSEGLAVWASACVSPGRTAEELMSSPTLAAAAQAAWPDAAPKLADALESSAPDVVADWFHMGVNPVGHPERFGYYAGARVAAIIACTTAPASLLRLTGREILRDVRAVLLRADSASGPASCDGRGGAVPR